MAKIKEGSVVTLKGQPKHKMTVQSIVGGVDGVDKVTVIWIHDGVVKTVEFEKHVLRLEDKNMAD